MTAPHADTASFSRRGHTQSAIAAGIQPLESKSSKLHSFGEVRESDTLRLQIMQLQQKMKVGHACACALAIVCASICKRFYHAGIIPKIPLPRGACSANSQGDLSDLSCVSHCQLMHIQGAIKAGRPGKGQLRSAMKPGNTKQ